MTTPKGIIAVFTVCAVGAIFYLYFVYADRLHDAFTYTIPPTCYKSDIFIPDGRQDLSFYVCTIEKKI